MRGVFFYSSSVAEFTALDVDSPLYVGLTDNLRERLGRHNAGEVAHTVKFRPWRIKTAVAFSDRQRASEFEGYLKTASGRAFAKKRL